MIIDENQLIAQLQSQDQKNHAFKKLISLYKERLYWHIRHIVKSHDDADDVLQNTFIKVFKNIDNFKGESKLYSWMYRIATNEALSFLKSKSKKQGISSEELQNQMLDNLQADVYFEGDEIQLNYYNGRVQLLKDGVDLRLASKVKLVPWSSKL